MRLAVLIVGLGFPLLAFAAQPLIESGPDLASVTPQMGSVETHLIFFADDSFSVEVGERGYDCYRIYGWGVRTPYVLDVGGGTCGLSGGSSDPRCWVDGWAATCPSTVCHFLATCEPCTAYGCTPP